MLVRVGAAALGLCLGTIASAQFEGDSRLDRRVTLRFEGNPIRQVLLEIKKQTGVELSVAQDISEDLVILLWREKPAADVLTLIAQHFDWTWEKQDDGYRLIRTPEQRDSETAAYRAQLISNYKETQEKLKEDLKRIRAADRARSKNSFLALQKTMQETGIESYEDYKVRTAVIRRHEDEWSGWAEIAYDAFCKLDANALLELEEYGYYVVSTKPGMYQHAFVPDPSLVAAGIEYARFQFERLIEKSVLYNSPQLNELVTNLLRKINSLQRLSVRFESSGGEPSLENLEVWCDFGGSWYPVFSRYFSDKGAFSPPQPLKAPSKTRLHEIPVAARVVRDSQQTPGWRLISVGKKGDTPSDPYLWRYGRILTKVLDETEFDFISDAYDSAGSVHAYFPNKETISVGDALDKVAETAQSAWMESNGVVALRARDWQFARATSLPRATCYFVEQRNRLGGFTIEQFAQLVNSLTTVQLTRNYYFWPVGYAAQVGQEFSTHEIVAAMRLFGHMSAPSRELLKQGGFIPRLSLDPIGRTLYDRAFLACEEVSPPFVLDEFIAATFTLRSLEDLIFFGEPTQQLNDLLSEESSLSLYVNSGFALYVNSGFALSLSTDRGFVTRPHEFTGTYVDDKWIWEHDGMMKACAVNDFAFTFSLRPGFANGSVVSLAFVDPDVPFGRRQDLPKPLLDAFDRAANEIKNRGG